MLSLDTETTGLDLRHGAKPFLVTMCDVSGENTWWEWDVDPLTRQPQVPETDMLEIEQAINEAETIVMQNPKFDVAALCEIGMDGDWSWERTYDTLLAGHLLASNHPHDLTAMALEYLGVDIQLYEDRIREACNEARSAARSRYPDWRIARKGLSDMPSAKDSTWKYDMWLPRTIAREEEYPSSHPWWTVCSEYANADSTATLALFKVQRKQLKERELWRIYLERLKVIPVVHGMERRGVTINSGRWRKLHRTYCKQAKAAEQCCVRIAGTVYRGPEDKRLEKLPKSGTSKALKSVLFDDLKLPAISFSDKTGDPSVDKSVLDHWLATLPRKSKGYRFVDMLRNYRRRCTAISYLEGYERFWLPIQNKPYWYILYPSLNPTGTDTLRFSSSNPNSQNICKREGFSLRYCFGPAPGREWWCLDAKNIELRIPAYEAGEKEMVDLFEREDEPPYYGSYHMLVFATLHPKKFAKYGMGCKEKYDSTWYQWTKNGNFAVQYGAVEKYGTADRAYHVSGAHARIQDRFNKIAKLNRRMIEFADVHGYVQTIPDKTVDPKRGYPLLCTRSKWGKIKETIPLNYHVQGTAMWWMMKAMIRCQDYLQHYLPNCYMIMQVHDELIFDFPERRGGGNEPAVQKIRRLMEQGGDDIGIPTPVSIEYYPEIWGEGISIA